MRDEELKELEALASACLRGGDGFLWGDFAPEGGFETPEAAIEELAVTLRKTFSRTPGDHTRHLYGVHLPDDDGGSIVVCHTGNGPTSEAHARFFSIAPRAVLALVEAVRRLTPKKPEARA